MIRKRCRLRPILEDSKCCCSLRANVDFSLYWYLTDVFEVDVNLRYFILIDLIEGGINETA